MMTSIAPPARPELTRAAAEYWMHASGLTDEFAVVARRGYYRDTMGVVGKNDRGIYDDAMAIVTPTTFATFNANCDPSQFGEGIASLMPGVWMFELGVHNRSKPAHRRYEALIQAEPFIVFRDDTTEFKKGETHPKYGRCLGDGKWIGWFGVNIHRGGLTTTGSAGCGTVVSSQWDAFIEVMKAEMGRHKRNKVPVVLTERDEL